MTRCEGPSGSRRSLESLMEAYQRSDEAAFTELADTVSPALKRFFFGPTVTRRHSDDLLQDFWMRVHRSRHTYEAGRPVLPWIFGIARYARADEYRKMSRTESHQEVHDDFMADPRCQARAAEARSDLNTLMALLPPRQRDVLHMLKVKGMSLKEVAAATDSNVNATKQMAHRAYVTLRAAAREGAARVN